MKGVKAGDAGKEEVTSMDMVRNSVAPNSS